MKVFLKLLHRMTEDIHKDPGVIVLSGEGGIGKTKLLKAMKAKASDMGFRFAIIIILIIIIIVLYDI